MTDFQTDALPIIAASPDDAAFHTCRFNVDWLQVLLGVVEDVLQERGAWDSEDEAVLDEMQSKVDQLLAQLSTEVSVVTQNVGDIVMCANATLPPGRLWCNGGTYNRVDYPELYAALDTAYIIDADTFKTPRLNGRVPVGTGTGYAVGQEAGAAYHVLTEAEMPAHNHSYYQIGNTFILNDAIPPPLIVTQLQTTTSGAILGQSNATVTKGGNQSHNNMQPYHVVRFCIVAQP